VAEAGNLLLALAAIVAGAAAFRFLFERLGLPTVAGEIVFGILAGPSLLGWAAPEWHRELLVEQRPVLDGLAWLGLALFILQVGLTTRWEGDAARSTVRTAMGGLILPLATGLALGVLVPHWFLAEGASFRGVLLVGVAITVSALPVLARILEDVGLAGSRIGAIAIGAATLDDLIGWALLGLLAVAGTQGAVVGFAVGVAAALAVAAALVLGERFAARRLDAVQHPSGGLFVGVVAAALFAAAFTDAVGLSAVLGPLGIGLLLARHHAMREGLLERLGQLTRAVLLPVFFVQSGAAVDLGPFGDAALLLPLVVVLVLATLSKVVGCALGGRTAGLSWREGFGLGALLNARGAVGLVVLAVGLEQGLLSTTGYSLLVVVVAATTTLAPIASRWILPPATRA
jgi:Kef-type K+ transport system membrane component KefB